MSSVQIVQRGRSLRPVDATRLRARLPLASSNSVLSVFVARERERAREQHVDGAKQKCSVLLGRGEGLCRGRKGICT